jgi:hypothetical protein
MLHHICAEIRGAPQWPTSDCQCPSSAGQLASGSVSQLPALSDSHPPGSGPVPCSIVPHAPHYVACRPSCLMHHLWPPVTHYIRGAPQWPTSGCQCPPSAGQLASASGSQLPAFSDSHPPGPGPVPCSIVPHAPHYVACRPSCLMHHLWPPVAHYISPHGPPAIGHGPRTPLPLRPVLRPMERLRKVSRKGHAARGPWPTTRSPLQCPFRPADLRHAPRAVCRGMRRRGLCVAS